ncbi:MAG TPA: LacI family DNA-binding transcriptional regulator, partial [Paludibacter sp.]|nr:LacI family DNA-binding transcriptional regulator [Paludibacter sp.]
MQQKRIRIKDIAKLAGVSAGTVDRVVHNRGNVSAKSREAVEKVLKEVNYRPNIHMS